MSKKIIIPKVPKIPTGWEMDKVKGEVKQLMHTTYNAHRIGKEIFQGKILLESQYHRKNHVTSFDTKGNRMNEIMFGSDGIHENTYNGGITYVKSIQKKPDGTLFQTTENKFDEIYPNNLIETNCYHADGSIYYTASTKYNAEGKITENLHDTYIDGKVISNRNEYLYDEKGNNIACKMYKNNILEVTSENKFNEKNQEIEHKSISDYSKGTRYEWHHFEHYTQKYNEYGDCYETTQYNEDGTVKKVYKNELEYDSEGNRIATNPNAEEFFIPYLDFNERDSDDNAKYEYDERGNWIKRTSFKKEFPINIMVREIQYHDDKSEKKFIHPYESPENREEIEQKDVKRSTYFETLTSKELKWVYAENLPGPDSFPHIRYYIARFGQVPSLEIKSGPYIEAIALLDSLKKYYGAVEIHSTTTQWSSSPNKLLKYTLIFPDYPGYIINATGISSASKDEFIVPSNVQHDDHHHLHFSGFHIFKPSSDSEKEHKYFELYLHEEFSKVTLDKKPDQPKINIIQVQGSSFSFKEYAVKDDFIIKDLNLNYGDGFGKFHEDLMKRFITGTQGLVLFHGEPGTGKTYYIRHLLRQMATNKKIVIYMPPNMVDHLVEPAFITFLSEEIKEWSDGGNFCVLLIEDAEPLLAKRQEGVRIQGITNLLNMSDGLLNDMLNLQIICTFNVELRRLDSALLRPGRLIARKEFKALNELDANLLASRLGIKHIFTGPATLGEIYSMRTDSNTLIHDVDSNKGASSAIDDLM